MRKNKICFLILLLVVSSSCNSQKDKSASPTNSTTPTSQSPKNSIEVVKVRALPVAIKPNETAEALVEVTVQSGYHINANPATFNYLIATDLQLPTTSEVSVNFIVYPTALTKSFPFAEKPLAVYEGTTNIKVQLKAAKTAKPGTQNLLGKLRVQACDDQVCYAPGTLELSIPLSIK